MTVDDRTAAVGALVVAVGATVAALPFLTDLLGVRPPTGSPAEKRVGRIVAAGGLVVVAAWVAQTRDGPAGFTALLSAGVTALLALVAVALTTSGIDDRTPAAMALVSAGVCFLATGVAARDDRLPRGSESAATVIGLLSVGAALFAPVEPLAFLGWAGWTTWLAGHLALRQ